MYQAQLDIPSPRGFLKGLRFMVQDYIMGGLVTKRPASDWFSGWDSPIFDVVQQGDFFLGTDKDLDNKIAPVVNGQSARVNQAILKVNSGSNNP